MSLNIDDFGANAPNLCYIDHAFPKSVETDKDEHLFKKQEDSFYQNEVNLVLSQKEGSLIDLDYTSSTKSKTKFDKVSNDSDDNSEQYEKTSKKRDLHKRNDVINKSTIRLIRKFFKASYNNESAKYGRVKKSLKLRQYKALVNTVVSQLLEKSSFDALQGQDRCKIFEIVGRVISTSLFSKLAKHYKSEDTDNIKSFINTLNNCCNAYTHSNFSEVTSSKYFSVVLDIFVSNGGENYIKEQNKNAESIDLICKSIKYYAKH